MNDEGFTLTEVLVATVMLATAVAGASRLVVLGALSVRTARTQSAATRMAADKMEGLRALVWAWDIAGVAITDRLTDLSTWPPGGGGRGLDPSPQDSLDRNVAGCVDYLDESGRWIGTGSEPPPGAVYIRRWNVAPLPSRPNDTVVLRVVVMTRAEALRPAGPADRVRWGVSASLVSLKTRKVGW